MPRLFIAIPVPESVGAAWLSMARDLPRSLRRVPPGRMHLTLHFIGEAAVEPIRSALAGLGLPRMQLKAAGPGLLARRGGAAVVWLGIEPDPALMALHAEIGDRLRTVGFEPERRAFQPHVTIARGRIHRHDSALEAFLRGTGDAASGPGAGFDVTSLVLPSSELRPDGPLYREEWSIPVG